MNFNQARVGVNTPRTCCAFHVTRFWTITDYVSENAFTYFGDVVDKNIAAILLILGNDSYRAWFFLMHSSGPERGVKKHSERGHQMKVLKTEDLGFQYIIRDLLWHRWEDTEMDRFFFVLQTTASCCKRCKIGLGPGFVWCPTGHCPWSLVVFFVH